MLCIRFDRFTNLTDTHTHTHTGTAWRHRPRLHSIARQNCNALGGNRSPPIYVTCQKNHVSRRFFIFWTSDSSCCSILRTVSFLILSLLVIHSNHNYNHNWTKQLTIAIVLTKPFRHWGFFVHLRSSNTNILIDIPAPIGSITKVSYNLTLHVVGHVENTSLHLPVWPCRDIIIAEMGYATSRIWGEETPEWIGIKFCNSYPERKCTQLCDDWLRCSGGKGRGNISSLKHCHAVPRVWYCDRKNIAICVFRRFT